MRFEPATKTLFGDDVKYSRAVSDIESYNEELDRLCFQLRCAHDAYISHACDETFFNLELHNRNYQELMTEATRAENKLKKAARKGT